MQSEQSHENQNQKQTILTIDQGEQIVVKEEKEKQQAELDQNEENKQIDPDHQLLQNLELIKKRSEKQAEIILRKQNLKERKKQAIISRQSTIQNIQNSPQMKRLTSTPGISQINDIQDYILKQPTIDIQSRHSPQRQSIIERFSILENQLTQGRQSIVGRQSVVGRQSFIGRQSTIRQSLQTFDSYFEHGNFTILDFQDNKMLVVEDDESESSDDDETKIVQKKEIRKIEINQKNTFLFDFPAAQQLINYSKLPLKQKIPDWFKWAILFYATINNALIPPWILSIPAEKYLRIAWRFFMQAIFMIPFCMMEKRRGDQQVKEKYYLKYIFNGQNLKQVYINSFSTSLWFTMCLFGFEWTYIIHSIFLSSLAPFMLSLQKIFSNNPNRHTLEIAGQIMIGCGILLIFSDSFTFSKTDIRPSAYDYKMTKYIHRTTFQRFVYGNLTPLSLSYFTSLLQQKVNQCKQIFPPHLLMFITFLFNTINMTISSYFLSGTDTSTENGADSFWGSFWGWGGLFTSEQFPGFMFMSIMLGLGSFISYSLISIIYDLNPIIPQSTAILEPAISAIIIQVVGVQSLPGIFIFQFIQFYFIGSLACMGISFIMPGLFIIALGQTILTQKVFW